MKRALALSAILLLLVARPAQTVGVEAWHDSAVPQSAFVAVTPRQGGAPTPAADRLLTEPGASQASGLQAGARQPARFTAHASPVVAAPATVSPSLRLAPATAAVRIPASTERAVAVAGTASWYRYVPGGAAAGPRLRSALGPGWRGSVVLVDGIPVTLSDWCGCPGGRVIDLDSRTFAALAPLSAGLVNVEVTW